MKRSLQTLGMWSAGLLALIPGSAAADNPAVEAAIVQLLSDHPQQGRAELIVDQTLSDVAQEKADDILARGYFAHTDPEGIGPNFLAQLRGYWLPAGYSNARNANNIESLARDNLVGPAEAEKAVNAWLASPFHRIHILGQNAFFSKQIRVGVGVVSDVEAERNVYVFLSAPPPADRDVLPPRINHSLISRGRNRPAQVMTHRGTAFDPSGVVSVKHRIVGMATLDGNFSRATAAWSAKVIVPGSYYRRIRKGRKRLVIQVMAEDAAGNVSTVTQAFKKFKKKKRKKKNRKRSRRSRRGNR